MRAFCLRSALLLTSIAAATSCGIRDVSLAEAGGASGSSQAASEGGTEGSGAGAGGGGARGGDAPEGGRNEGSGAGAGGGGARGGDAPEGGRNAGASGSPGRGGANAAGAGEGGAPAGRGGEGSAESGTAGAAQGGTAGAAQGGSVPGGTAGATPGGTAGTAQGGAEGAAAGSAGQGGQAGSAGTGELPLSCATARVTTAGTSLISESNAGTDDALLSCGSPDAQDYVLEWVAPSDGYYSLNANGSSFPSTALGVYEPDCDALGDATAERGCNNAVIDGNGSYADVPLKFQSGEHVLVALEGYLGETGTVEFNAEPITCPAIDLEGHTFPTTLTTTGGTNSHSGDCGGDGFTERSFVWVPPSSEVYELTVETSSSNPSVQPALYLERGAQCGGELLGCNASAASVPGLASVTRYLPAGNPVTIIVDSLTATTGTFELDIQPQTVDCPVEPSVDFQSLALVDEVLDGNGVELVASSCAPSSSEYFYPQKTYGIEVDMSTGLSCTLVLESDNPIEAFLLEGSQCGGAEVAGSCQASTCTLGDCTLGFSFNSTRNGSYVLVVQGPAQSTIGAFGTPATFSTSMACIL